MNDFKNDADLFGEDLIVASQRWLAPLSTARSTRYAASFDN